ncbi:Putative pyridoxal phosphate-dependent aminotransferase EpsN [Dyadobacter sp. CECT 9275]|uniref:GDP-perosamine synthase n=1 Tax=Dyadobacter helix TaxID=2822344 RepID=A0A916JEC0_9BACT|nr:aminotransferase class I/II-fold pyridoxal phosphate-dependent enzyme [Dyadobacter sp. CECT 9275]CAG5008973.1 Putative pyridoxal phosphate-dependent aminotransferase EpsN [Dyadobacter sp. CECT 9275]
MSAQSNTSRIWLSSPHLSGREIRYVQEAFETNWIAPLGPNVDNFEKELGEYIGSPHVAALSSGTAALHLALILSGVKTGDIVLCQSFTFSASANPIVYQGAIPVFIDSEPDTWNICPQALEEAIVHFLKRRQKPKAVILVHLYGMPAQLDEVLALCATHDIPVIEDAAEALGSAYKAKRVGVFGKFGILSFNGNKIITTSGGGALLSADEKAISQSRFLATQARDNAPHYEHTQIGYNYRMSNVCAGIGRGQLEVIAERVHQRRKNFDFYKNHLAALPGIRFQNEPEGFFSNRWLTALTVDPVLSGGVTRENIRLKLLEENIESRPLWKPMHLQPVFEGAPYFGGKVSEKLFETGLCLPSGSNLSETDMERVVLSIKKCFD